MIQWQYMLEVHYFQLLLQLLYVQELELHFVELILHYPNGQVAKGDCFTSWLRQINGRSSNPPQQGE